MPYVPPPPITGEGFNWGYFIGAVASQYSGTSSGPTFPVATGSAANHLFDVETPWVFQDYLDRMISPIMVVKFSPTAPYQGYIRFVGGFDALFNSGPPINLYSQGLVGTIVTFDQGTTVTLSADAFNPPAGTSGQIFTYPLGSFPSYVATYSGMHLVS